MAAYDTMDYQHLLKGKQALVVNCESETDAAVEELFVSHGARVRILHSLDALE